LRRSAERPDPGGCASIEVKDLPRNIADALTRSGVARVVLFPLIADGAMRGVLGLELLEAGQNTDEDQLRALRTIADVCSIMLFGTART